MARESRFQRQLVLEIQKQYPGAIVLKNDPNYKQGIPDWLILFNDRWAAFEAKADESSPHRPNQDHYIQVMDDMSFASFVYPQNKEWFLDELQQTLRPFRRARLSFRV